jgi:hypothetical protein
MSFLQNTGTAPKADSVCFITMVLSEAEIRHAAWMVASLRRFGGQLSACQVWILAPRLEVAGSNFYDFDQLHWIPMDLPEQDPHYDFGLKVAACAQAERLCGPSIASLVWLNPECLVFQPPDLFSLSTPTRAAFRPVHIRNVGSAPFEPLDAYWTRIYEAIGIADAPFTVESFIDAQILRPYFNSHLFAVDPRLGLMRRWLEKFEELVKDQHFQKTACKDKLHQIFLHQAVLSTLVVSQLEPEQIRILPAGYSYPLHLHERVPPSRRVHSLEDTICAVYEDDDSLPGRVAGLEIGKGLHEWIDITARELGSIN